jgi:hypothetical protein
MENVTKEETYRFNDVFSWRFDVCSITIANKDTKTIKKVPQEFTSLDLVNKLAIGIQKKLKNCIIEVDHYERDLSGHLKVCGHQRVNSDYKLVWVPYDVCFHELEHPEKYKNGIEIGYE